MRFPTHRALRKQTQRAFTLVEMIGVLAIIAILASLLIPRVFQAIGDSKISNSASTCNSMKAAVNEFYGKYGKICDSKGASLNFSTNSVFEDWDFKALLPEGFIEKPFSVRIGNGKIGSSETGSRLRVVKVHGLDGDDDADVEGAYNLDGSAAVPKNDIEGTLLVEAVIPGVELSDARALSERIDGGMLTATNNTVADLRGRVKYELPGDGEDTTTVHIYMAHK